MPRVHVKERPKGKFRSTSTSTSSPNDCYDGNITTTAAAAAAAAAITTEHTPHPEADRKKPSLVFRGKPSFGSISQDEVNIFPDFLVATAVAIEVVLEVIVVETSSGSNRWCLPFLLIR